MNGPEHYAEAERLLTETSEKVRDRRQDGSPLVTGFDHSPERAASLIAAAQVHATLALVAVTAEGTFDPEGRPLLAKSAATEGWERVL